MASPLKDSGGVSAVDHTSAAVAIGGGSGGARGALLLSAAKKAAAADQKNYANFHYEVKAERAVKWIFDPVTETWSSDPTLVKIEETPFNHGAFRAVHRMKVWDSGDWHKSSNWVCKLYIKDPPEGTKAAARNDVELQMLSKYYGNKFNHHQPPKAIDFIYTFVLELVDRPGSPSACVEAHIDGEYIKYSNNSGYIDKEHLRNTPHAFSHFTFEESGGKLLICDIQGVNDLYTDPQIHSSDHRQFGTGNLGLRGMALFLYTHDCNFLCKRLNLPEFDNYIKKNAPKPSATGATGGDGRPPPLRLLKEGTMTKSFAAILSNMNSMKLGERNASSLLAQRASATNLAPTVDLAKYTVLPLPDSSSIPMKPKIISRIHYELGKMHETGQLHGDDPGKCHDADDTSRAAAFYHYQIAAHGGVMSALLALARIHSGLPRDVLPEATSLTDTQLAFKYLVLAAERGYTVAAYHVAKKLEKGEQGWCSKNWLKASEWYQISIERNSSSTEEKKKEDEGSSTDTPPAEEKKEQEEKAPAIPVKEDTHSWEIEIPKYEVLASLGKMYEDGGNGIEQDYAKAAELYREAADEAMEAAKGRIATKLYEQAEICEGMLE